ncbi:alpha/beta fold hydrolase [Paenibacillus lentus]|uniref:Alpha/beta hydrolase n=1 Tax=Paenibacillus lentus TaxID=1338368 RepID=A0A3S8RWM1_9BACL|nr:alpha/beta hydrolase [Paenibacillus lentus]AZK47368.1 alpha/beta hydrolase [Paenibacillus lentus]
MCYIEVEQGVKIFVEDVNPGPGSIPILFIHGWPVNHKMFEYQWNILPKYGYRCIGIDLRGFGKSDRPWMGYDYNRLADDVRAVVASLGLNSFILTGFSIGGAIAIRYMARYAGYGVCKLVLISAAAPRFSKSKNYPYGLPVEDINALINQTYRNRPQMVAEFGEKFFYSKITPAFRDWFQDLGLAASGHGTIQCLFSLRDEDLRPDLNRITVPTGLFHGAHDQYVPFASAEVLHRGIPQSELYRFERSGHGVFYDELEAFNEAYLHFLRK